MGNNIDNIEYSLSELAMNRSIVTGWSLYTGVFGFLDVYVTSCSFLKQVTAPLDWADSFVLVPKFHRGKNILEVYPKLVHAVFGDVEEGQLGC